MDKQEPTFESAASSAENAAAGAKAESSAEPKTEPETLNAEADSSDPSDGGKKISNFPLAIYSPWTPYRRAGMLAATIAVAIALGGLIGSASTYSLTTPKAGPAEPAHNLQAAMTKITKDVAALKTSVEASSRAMAGQMSKINERFDRAQAEPMAKIAALTETVARLEKRLTASADASRDITGSIAGRAAAAKDQSKPIIVEGWVLRDVYRGRAMVEHRDSLYEVMPGADLPGIGKVQTITQQNGRWVVVTPKGLIVSMR